jgi:hypothetical protein
MLFGNMGMVEIVRGSAPHAQPFHHAPRSVVRGHCKRDNLFQAEILKGVLDHLPGTLGGQAPTPLVGRQSPSNLYTRCEMGGEAGNRQADEAYEPALGTKFRRPLPEAILFDMSDDAMDQ